MYDYYQEIKDNPIEKAFEIAQAAYDKKSSMMDGESGDPKAKWKPNKDPEVKRKKQEHKQLLKKMAQQISQANKNKDFKLANKLMIERTELVSKSRVELPNSNYRRASELYSPAPANHFLREFGQSDREAIENANTDPAVTQVLRLMNGFVDQKIGKDINSVLVRNALSAGNPHNAIDAIYLTVLSRRPTYAEKNLWKSDFSQNKKEAFTDLVWTLLNSNEFIFVR